MTSSQPVTTPNAINFTPDNKRAYAYSGGKALTSAEGQVKQLEFQTNSEYVVATFQFWYGDLSSDWWKSWIYFNDQLIIHNAHNYNASPNNAENNLMILVIPPFTKVQCDARVGSDADSVAVTMTGKAIGMPNELD
jgi:hypothetical protein